MALYPARGSQNSSIDAFVRIYNNDGSEAGACGNGMRCVAALVSEETGRTKLNFETSAGLIPCWRGDGGLFTVDMGKPRLRWDEIPLAEEFADTRRIELEIGPRGSPIMHSPSVVSMGNPHAIFWVEDPAAYDLGKIGPLLENHPLFPERANITLAATPSRDRIVIRTWERGAGLTKACGSAACAAAVAAARLERTGRKVTVTLPGGDLFIEWRESDDHVLMTGPVEYEHKGRFDAALMTSAGANMSVEVVTFGCRLNLAESEVIRREAERAGFSDTVVVNTCAVTAEAVRQARQTIRALRRDRPQAKIVVTGCAAQTEPQTFVAMTEADHVLGNAEKLSADGWGASRNSRFAEDDRQRHHGGQRQRGASDRGLRRPQPRFRPGAERLRSPLHLLHHPLRPRQFALGADGGRGRRYPPAGRKRLWRDRAHRRRHHELWR